VTPCDSVSAADERIFDHLGESPLCSLDHLRMTPM
jgi:hypothetical protein